MATENPQILEALPLDSGRAEIDTSAPFESVKEAANRFGGMGFWKPLSHKPSHHVSEVLPSHILLFLSLSLVHLFVCVCVCVGFGFFKKQKKTWVSVFGVSAFKGIMILRGAL